MILQKHILQKYFGYKTPKFTLHALQRFVERIYHVSPEQYNGWIKIHHKEVYYDILLRLSNSVEYVPSAEHLKYLQDRYKKNLKLLICNNLVFIIEINNSINLVTCYLKDKDNIFL